MESIKLLLSSHRELSFPWLGHLFAFQYKFCARRAQVMHEPIWGLSFQNGSIFRLKFHVLSDFLIHLHFLH